jgi:hypothetical protein
MFVADDGFEQLVSGHDAHNQAGLVLDPGHGERIANHIVGVGMTIKNFVCLQGKMRIGQVQERAAYMGAKAGIVVDAGFVGAVELAVRGLQFGTVVHLAEIPLAIEQLWRRPAHAGNNRHGQARNGGLELRLGRGIIAGTVRNVGVVAKHPEYASGKARAPLQLGIDPDDFHFTGNWNQSFLRCGNLRKNHKKKKRSDAEKKLRKNPKCFHG